MRKPNLLAGCAVGALFAAVAAPASAQSFQGTPTVVTGAATVTTGVNTTNITVTTAETVINWAAEDTAASGAINFQPVGTTATFERIAAGAADYTVLNRIIPVDGVGNPVVATVAFNGTVNSVIVNDPGGHIWFYSPYGVIAGATSVFNVGSLILTTNDIGFVPNPPGGFGSIYGPGGLIQFDGPDGSTGFVRVDDGAELNATGLNNAYVALVAPRVVQQGYVNADGQVAYIAAEDLDMYINVGLFDFVITVGTTDPEGIVHTGTTTGPDSVNAADQQRISMVALPKNDALTMMLSGAIGYTPAATAALEGSSVVLGAGFTTDSPTALPGNALGSIAIGDSVFSNELTAYASDAIDVAPTTGTASFVGDATLYGLNSVGVVADAGEQVLAADLFDLHAGVPGTGGAVDVRANGGGLISVSGLLNIDASSNAATFVAAPAYLDANGGFVTVTADGGSISAADLFVDAQALAGFDVSLGGIAQGGSIDLTVQGGGTITAGNVNLDTDGTGGGSDTVAGDGNGGSIGLYGVNGPFNFGNVSLSADGTGGESIGEAGDGFGGTVTILLDANAHIWNDLVASADSREGGQATPGIGLPGSATGRFDGIELTVTGPATLTVVNAIDLTADSYVGTDGQPGFTGFAGGVHINVLGTGAAISAGTGLTASASAFLDGKVTSFDPTRSPTQLGGIVEATIDGGILTAPTVSFSANAVGLSGVTEAGPANGGTVNLSVLNGGIVSVFGGGGPTSMSLTATGYGSPGPISGDAFGGFVNLLVDGGSISTQFDLELAADGLFIPLATVPADGEGFDAYGGDITVETLNSGAIGTNGLIVHAIGDSRVLPTTGTPPPGGLATAGNGGNGLGGDLIMTIGSGDLSGTLLRLDASGYGGASTATDGAVAFQSGAGTGGTLNVTVSGGTFSYNTMEFIGDGTGGGGGPAATGVMRAALAGDGAGGTVVFNLLGGALTIGDTLLSASGTGADGMDHDGDGDATGGGLGTGGLAQMQAPSGWAGFFESTNGIGITAYGTGGTGGVSAGFSLDPPTGINGDGGTGSGGSALVDLADGSFAFGNMWVEAIGYGGDSGDALSGIPGAFGGPSFGGIARFALIDGPTGPVGARSIDRLSVNSSAYGGQGSLLGGSYFGSPTEGNLVFTAQVFDATTPVTIGGDLTLTNDGNGSVVGTGLLVTIGGAPLVVDGATFMAASNDVEVNAAELLHGVGNVSIFGRYVRTTGLIESEAAFYLSGVGGLEADLLSAGATTRLESFNGPVIVNDLASVDLVTASGASIEIHSLGALAFADLDAFASLILVETVGDLDFVTADAAASLTLRSTTGAVTGTSVANSDAATVEGQTGVTLFELNANGTTQLASATGTVDVDSLTSTGPVSVTGNLVEINGPGALTFTTAQSNTALRVTTTGDLAFAAVDAGGNLRLESTDGALTASGNVTGGQTGLYAGTDITLAGNLTAAGPLVAQAGGTFAVTGDASADSADIAGDSGISMGAFTVAGTTTLNAANGPIVIAELQSGDLVTAIGESVDIRSTLGLAFANLGATDGAAFVETAGDLDLISAIATGPITLRSTTGAVTATGPVTGGGAVVEGETGVTLLLLNSSDATQLASPSGRVDIGTLVSTGPVSVTADQVDIDGLGDLTFTTAEATGAMRITASGDLAFATVNTDGELYLESVTGALTASGDARGAAGVSLFAATDIRIREDVFAGGPVLVVAGGTFRVGLTRAYSRFGRIGSVDVTADAGISMGLVLADSTVSLIAVDGPVTVGDLQSDDVTARGESIDIRSAEGLGFAAVEATAGNIYIETAGGLGIDTDASATGWLMLQANGGSVGTENLTAGTWLQVDASGEVRLGNVSAATDAVVSARSGRLRVGDVTAGDDLWLSVFGTDPASTLTAGNLVTTGLGDDTAAGPTALFPRYPGYAGPVGNVTRVRSVGSLAIGDVTTPGQAILATVYGTISAGTLAADEAVIVLGNGDIDFTAALTDGALYVADNSMFDLLPDAYDPASLIGVDPVRTEGSLLITSAVDAGSVTVAVGDDLTLADVTSGGATLLSAGGAIDVAGLASAGTVTADAGDNLFIDGIGALTFATAEALNEMTIVTTGDLAFGSVNSGLNLTLESTDGSLTATGDVRGLFADLSADDDIRIDGDLNSGGILQVDAGGSFSVTGDAFSDDAAITAAHGITLASLTSGEITRLEAVDGNILIPSLQTPGRVTARGLEVDITSPGSLQFDEATAFTGDVDIVTGGNLLVSFVNAANNVDLDVGDTFTLLGEARGDTITARSADIVIAEGATLGLQDNTDDITLVNIDDEQRMYIGGDGGSGDYSLDRDEIARLGSNLSVTILSDADIEIGDFAFGFGGNGNIGAGGTLEISSPATIAILGEVALATVSADDTFTIDPSRIALNTDSGSIAMLDDSGAPLGRLSMIGDTIAVATSSVIGQIIEFNDFARINEALDEPGGVADPLRAGSLSFEVIDGLYIQNSGATTDYSDRAGFTAGSIAITTESTSTRIAINGRILTPAGPLVGLDTQQQVMINGAPAAAGGQFDAASTINGCAIGANCAPEPERPLLPNPPSDTDLVNPLPKSGPPSLFVAPIIELADNEPLVQPPLVDEPITGIGNDDLWEPICPPDEPGCDEGDGTP